MKTTDTKQIAKDLVTSSSSAQAKAPVQEGKTYSSNANSFISRLEGMANSGKYSNVDTDYIHQTMEARQRGMAAKRASGVQFASSLKDIRQRMADAEFERRQQAAKGGFIGSGAAASQQVQANRPISATLGQAETGYLNKLKGINANISSAREGELQALKPLFARGMAQEASKISLYGDKAGYSKKDNLVGMESDEGFFGKLAGGIFGKDQDSIGKLDESAFKANADIQKLAGELGININDGDFVSRVNEEMKSVLTGTADSVYDRTTDMYLDLGNGPQRIGESTKSLGKAILDDILGAINIGAVAAIVFTAGMSSIAAVGASAGGAVAEGATAAIATGAELGAATLATDIATTSAATLAAEAGFAGTAEFGGSVIGDGIAQAIEANAGAIEALGGTMTEEITASIQTAVTDALSSLPEEVLATQTGASINAAANAAMLSIQEGLAGGAELSEELIQASVLNAVNMSVNAEAITAVASGSIEAGVGELGATEAAANTGIEVGATEGGLEAEGLAGEAQGVKTPISQKLTNGVSKVVGEKGGNAVGKAVNVATKIIKGVLKPIKFVAKGGKMVWSTPGGKTLIISAAALNGIARIIPKLRETGISEADIQKIIESEMQDASEGES